MASVRTLEQLYPNFSAEMTYIRDKGLTQSVLYKILNKHRLNSEYNRKLYQRYSCISGSVPIMNREPRISRNAINNKINNDFFSEIVDFKTGYLAGKPIAYSYSKTDESTDTTGGEEAVEKASKALTDFLVRNNMYGVDMEVVRLASIYGYSGRLFYIDTEEQERVMAVHGFETIILSETSISEPEFAIRYFCNKDVDGKTIWTVEFYDAKNITIFKGGSLNDLTEIQKQPHLFDYCPLQGIMNNGEMTGDAEKVLSLIDDYDKVISDNSNEIESFVHAYMVYENLNINDDTMKKAQSSGAIRIQSAGTKEGKVYFLTKDINDAFTEHHLKRLEDNIYRFSSTPNLNDESFGSASGISLKFKLQGLETKCGMTEARLKDAAAFMWKLLASAWEKKKIPFDPLQVGMNLKRNFPLDISTEAQAVATLIAAGFPKREAFAALSFVDDPDDIMKQIEAEMYGIEPLDEDELDKGDDDLDDNFTSGA